MELTVFGATGGTGRELVRQSLEAGHRVTAVVRDPARLPVSHERLTVLTLDVTDAEALRPAVEGREAALSALGSPSNKGAGIASAGTRAILRALEDSGVRRYVGVSAAPVGPIPAEENVLGRKVIIPLVRKALAAVYADLAVMEEEIRRSAVEWTVVRPPHLKDKPLTRSYRKSTGGVVPNSRWISRADLAHAMLSFLNDPAMVKQVVGVGR
ncbi:epimerase [Wenjunlia vitaminophila]|uniref:Epimerase n=1 Tax=Wenjunlia vitaminophila TaxID=76728 RepID=A0A0T6LP43_WENVI|nr:SDR family oxidoreductase [Wenjunlia vitaminophila]KRV47689.1 epimerase [Wenjunlia vitaminophila]